MDYTADTLNAHLRGGGVVQVSTYTRSVLYTKRNAGQFIERKDGLYVRRGKSVDYLGRGGCLVAIRLGWRLADRERTTI